MLSPFRCACLSVSLLSLPLLPVRYNVTSRNPRDERPPDQSSFVSLLRLHFLSFWFFFFFSFLLFRYSPTERTSYKVDATASNHVPSSNKLRTRAPSPLTLLRPAGVRAKQPCNGERERESAVRRCKSRVARANTPRRRHFRRANNERVA